MQATERVSISGSCPNCSKHVTLEGDAPVKVKDAAPSYQPRFKCRDGSCDVGVHKNKNYREFPKTKCADCDQFNPFPENPDRGYKNKCLWCGSEDLEEIDPEDLRDLGIPAPEPGEHDH
jgi:hypothetical protein